MATAGQKTRSTSQAHDADPPPTLETSASQAYRYCEQIARSHYENFPVGSFLVPRKLRKHFYAIYAFARTADDFADEGYEDGVSEESRLAQLEDWSSMLSRSFTGEASHPIFIALAGTRQRFHLPTNLFEDLLSAFRQDVTTRQYDTFLQLLDYCRRSANPVGRLILLLFGYHDPKLFEMSDLICTALQLTNHWQDVGVDAAKERVYLPIEDLAAFGLDTRDILAKRDSQSFRQLIQFQVGRTREMFRRGKPLCLEVRGRLGIELRAVWLGGWRILQLIEENGYDVFHHRPVITHRDKLKLLSGALRKEVFTRS